MRARAIALIASALIFSGCGGGSNTFYVAPPTPAPLQVTNASGTAITSVSLVGAGASQTVTLSEPGYAGTFTAISSDSDVATVTPASGTSFTITAVSGGTATITFNTKAGTGIKLAVSVTVTGIVVY